MNNPAAYKAALYLRLSKEDENSRESQSITNQKSLLEEYASQNKLMIVEVYTDDGYSGTDFDRPDFKRLIRDIEAGLINMVITKDLSRLGRDYILTGHFLEKYFPEHGVRYISLLDGIDTGIESSANDITPFKAILNDLYAKDISKKIKSVKRDKINKGLFIGPKPPFGYKRSRENKNLLVIDEDAALIIKDIFKMALEGASGRQIAHELTALNVPTPAQYGKLKPRDDQLSPAAWQSQRVNEILANQVYLGNMVQGRVQKINYKSKKLLKLPKDKWTVVEGTHEPIISRADFEKVQLLLETRRKTRHRTHDYLLKGLIICGDCQEKMGLISRKRKDDYYYYLRCRTYTRCTSLCSAHNILLEDVTLAVLEELRRACQEFADREAMLGIAKEELAKVNQNNCLKQNISVLERKLKTLNSQIDQVYLDKVNNILLQGDFERIYQQQQEERTNLLARLKQLEIRAEETEKPFINLNPCVMADDFLEFKDPSKEEVATFIDKIEVFEDRRVVLHFKF